MSKSVGDTSSEHPLQCEMDLACRSSVTYLDDKGFIYCTVHGLERQASRNCRKLREHELNRLKRGLAVKKY